MKVLIREVPLLNKLTTQARYMEVIRSGHWQWVFDNVNMHQRVRHEREGMYRASYISYTKLITLLL